MKPDLRPFVEAMRKKDIKDAKEKLEGISQRLNLDDDFWKGYHLALKGMIAAMEAGGELTVIRRIVDGKCSRKDVEGLIKQTRGRISMIYRPKDERGFDSAWVDALRMI